MNFQISAFNSVFDLFITIDHLIGYVHLVHFLFINKEHFFHGFTRLLVYYYVIYNNLIYLVILNVCLELYACPVLQLTSGVFGGSWQHQTGKDIFSK